MSDITEALAAAASGGKRARVHNTQMVTKVPAALKSLVTEYANANGTSDATVVRQALAEFFERRGYGK